jgi:8-oxo-dGTP diphosphatase
MYTTRDKMVVKEIALCHVIKNGTLLLIKAESGVNKGKWNAANAEIVQGEKPDKSAIKTLYQQTGIYANKVVDHGLIRLFLNGKTEYDYRIHVFSTKVFSGDVKPNTEGEAKWFATTDLPYYEMWADDKYWINLVLQGKKFDADFFFDEKNEKIIKYSIKERQEVTKRIMPIIILLAVLAVVAFGITSSGILSQKAVTTTIPKNTIALQPTVTTTIAATNTVTTNTPVTTTIPATPVPPSAYGSPEVNESVYYVTNMGNPSSNHVYYAVWQPTGTPATLSNVDCTIYPTYTFCTSIPQSAVTTFTPNSSTSGTTSGGLPPLPAGEERIRNPDCPDASSPGCYNVVSFN